ARQPYTHRTEGILRAGGMAVLVPERRDHAFAHSHDIGAGADTTNEPGARFAQAQTTRDAQNADLLELRWPTLAWLNDLCLHPDHLGLDPQFFRGAWDGHPPSIRWATKLRGYAWRSRICQIACHLYPLCALYRPNNVLLFIGARFAGEYDPLHARSLSLHLFHADSVFLCCRFTDLEDQHFQRSPLRGCEQHSRHLSPAVSCLDCDRHSSLVLARPGDAASLASRGLLHEYPSPWPA